MTIETNPRLEEGIIKFWEMPYNRELVERALYPIPQLNYLTHGMELGEMTLVAGETGAGKTTFISQCIKTIIKHDKLFCAFGESTLEKQQISTYRQLTPYGENNYEYVKYYKNGEPTVIGSYFVDQESENKVKSMTKDRLYWYNTKKGMAVKTIIQHINYAHKKYGIDYFIIDNLMQIETFTTNEVKEMKDNLEIIRRYLIDNKVHIVILAHYRKQSDYTNIRRRLEEIAGTSTAGNKCATALNIIRLDNVDRNSKPYISLRDIVLKNGYEIDQADAVIEVLKTRGNKLGFVALGYNHITNIYYEIDKIKDFKENKKAVVTEEKKQVNFKDMEEITVDLGDLPF